jgi:hypothetical protein
LKARLAHSNAFDASSDLYDAAMDIINGVAFAFDDDLSTVKQKLENTQLLQSHQLHRENGRVVFPTPPEIPDISSFKAMVDHLSEQFQSLKPTWAHQYQLLTDSIFRRNVSRKEDRICKEINKSLARLKNGDTAQYSATDHVLQREKAVAEKEGRRTDFFSRRIIDEASLELFLTMKLSLMIPVIRIFHRWS